MPGEDTPEEFPDVNHKLAAPKKLSAFEKDRQAAQAKEKRAEAENAAALKAFEDSFAAGEDDDDDDDDDDPLSNLSSSRGPPGGPRGGAGPGYGGPGGRYGMPPNNLRSGPGSLGFMSGPPPPSLKRKRALDEMREAREAQREQEMAGQDDSRSEARGTEQLATQDDEREIDAPRPTIQLSAIPPTVSADDLKMLLRDHVKVYSLRMLPPLGPGSSSKRSFSAIATLLPETPTEKIDTAVSALKGKYLGHGHYLSISRHLSSATLHPTLVANATTGSSEPFGAERPKDQQRTSMRSAPPPTEQRGFAPPESYDTPSRSNYSTPGQMDSSISVRPPSDMATLRAVHTVVEHLLLQPDPERALETEAMLMNLPEVQKDERFAFLFDARSAAGVYYRFLLWTPEDRDEAIRDMKRGFRGSERIHEDVRIDWHRPYSHVPFPDLKSLSEIVTDMDYVSSDEESDDDGEQRRFNTGREEDAIPESNEKKHLTPIQRARFVHLLSRLPTSNARLRKGDVARVTNFVINRAGQGAEDIVDTLLLNVERPFSSSLAAKYEDSQSGDDDEMYEPDEDLSNLESDTPQQFQSDAKRDEDPSNAKLIALYLISDVLSASSTAGARNAWKYRQLFETGFKAQRTFEHLGKLDRELAWGRLKAEQWKRKIGVVFETWENWSVFSADVLGALKTSFLEPPLSEGEKAQAKAEAEKEERKKQEDKLTSKFKRVGQNESSSASASPGPPSGQSATAALPRDGNGGGQSRDDEQEKDTDGKKSMVEVGGNVPMPDVDNAMFQSLDGAADERPRGDGAEGKIDSSATPPRPDAISLKQSGPRKRMRAEDMFADSDDD